MTIKQVFCGWVVRWRLFGFVMVLIPIIINLGGCLEAFTQATNRSSTTPYDAYEARRGLPQSDLPTPQLLDIRLNVSDD